MSLPVCPYCRASIDAANEPATVCPICATPHHRDCWEENGGCTVFGCSAAPVEEAMVQVSASELRDTLPASGFFEELNGAPRSSESRGSAESTGVPPPPSVGGGEAFFTTGTSGYPWDDPAATSFTHPEVRPASTLERSSYVWLAVCSGFVGAHNLYANRTSAGIIQLCVSLLSCFLLAPFVWIWALVEAANVDRDGDGFPMG